MTDKIFISRLEAECVIGIFKRERKIRQKVWMDLELPLVRERGGSDWIRHTIDYKRVAKTVLRLVSGSRFYLIETLAEKIADRLLRDFKLPSVTVTVSKPGAVRFSENVGITLTRTNPHRHASRPALISLGSNVGKETAFPRAIKRLGELFDLRRMSHVYESRAVGSARGGPFWNAVAEIETLLPPPALKKRLRAIEKELGRRRSPRDKFAPRPMDLDIVFYNGRISHPDALSMPYILVPLAEIAPDFIPPETGKTALELLAEKAWPASGLRKVAL